MKTPITKTAIQMAALSGLSILLTGCVLAPYDPGPPGPPVAAYGPCCYAYPEYPAYYGPAYVNVRGGYYGGGGGGYWRR